MAKENILRIDKAIKDTSNVISDNIARLGVNERGLLSQNILGHIRNLVEYVAIKAIFNGEDVNPNDYQNVNVPARKKMRQNGKLRFLYEFHELLQKSVSHYTMNKDGSERLMLKYYEYLLRIKFYLKKEYKLEILENIENFPLNTDNELIDYYTKIAERIEAPSKFSYTLSYNERYYVQKVKPFFVKQKIYYEVTFTTAIANTSKFDRVIAFTRQEIQDNYAVKFSIHKDKINILNKEMSILIIDGYEVSIRRCELEKFSKILGIRKSYSTNSNEYRKLMRFLTYSQMSLTELISSEQDYYNDVKSNIMAKTKVAGIYELLDKCREIIIEKKAGSNILRYLLYKMNNRIIKLQYNNEPCSKLSNLYLKYGCIPFEDMPYCTSLVQHNPKIYDLLNSIPTSNRDYELFARYIKNNTEIAGELFTNRNKIKKIDNIDNLVEDYNNSLYCKHTSRKLKEYKGSIYIEGYVDDSAKIIKKLREMSSFGLNQYTESVDLWFAKKPYAIDDKNKKEALRQMFKKSHVALIYGAAGTGKSTLINHVANFWEEKDKIFLANTHSAVDNLKRKVTADKSEYSTIASFLSNRNLNTNCEVLFIDECSTVSNSDMRKILEKADFKLLVLVGDVYQIESIYFGNWLSIAQWFIPATSIFELKSPYRTTDKGLLIVWERVRHLDKAILEPLVKNGYVSRFDESIFERSEDDEIILCLNYDGLYGINNINRFLQDNNPHEGIMWGINTYKVDDPVLFNESNVFSPLIHNNTKGRIVGIQIKEKEIWFDIEVDELIDKVDARHYDLKFVSESKFGNPIIRFKVNKYQSTDEDDDNNSTVVPFQVAYAVSIHKAQGLEYDSVKIVITNEIEEQITHSIFYTAITRARKRLKIYWSPETEKTVLEQFKIKDLKKDANLLAQLYNLK